MLKVNLYRMMTGNLTIGSNVSLICSVSGNPVHDIKWYRDGNQIHNNNETYNIHTVNNTHQVNK